MKMGTLINMNTTRKGQVRCIIFKDGDLWYGVALEFNIVESADDADVAMVNLNEAIQGYVESQKKIGGIHDFSVLNQKPDQEYEKMWSNLNSEQPIPTPYEVRYFGITRVNA